MPILNLTGLEKYYGAMRVFSGVDLEIEAGQKLALVGRNGCGKTTLLRIAAGLEQPDRGEVALARGTQVALLAQTFQCQDRGNSLWTEMEILFADLLALTKDLEEAAAAIASGRAGAMERYAALQEECERRGGYAFQPRIEKVLRGLGFTEEDWVKPVGVLSGGEMTRAALARMLLREPDLILLDEPTNHLDLWAVSWLEEYLAAYKGAVLVVSHDRYFLDRVAQGVYELAGGRVRYYRGNYSSYREAKAAEQHALDRAREAQEREIARKERLVREAAADERSKRQARSIAKSLARMEPLATPAREEPRMRLELAPTVKGGRNVMTVAGLSKSYAGQTVLREVSFGLAYGEKVGIIGPNGAGKTTLLRLLLGHEKADRGSIQIGYNTQIEYFAQEETWRGSGTVFSAVQDAGAGDNLATRSHLARFLFRGEEVWKNVKDLSGGERRRLALAVLTLSRANCLLLDEPTNHLDLPSLEALEEAIRHFPGTILVVSHDRYFLGRIADRLLALVDGRLLPFGGYAEFAAWHAAEEARLAEARAREVEMRREQQRRERVMRQQPRKEERQRAKALAEIESALASKEEARAALMQEIARPEIARDFAALRELSTRLADLERELAELYEEWGTVADGSQT